MVLPIILPWVMRLSISTSEVLWRYTKYWKSQFKHGIKTHLLQTGSVAEFRAVGETKGLVEFSLDTGSKPQLLCCKLITAYDPPIKYYIFQLD